MKGAKLAVDARESGRDQRARVPSNPNLTGTTCWRSSTEEHLICNQAVVGSIPIASFEDVVEHQGARQRQTTTVERYPSGQREQTVNLPASAYGGSNPPLSTIFPVVARVRDSQVTKSGDRVGGVFAGIAQLVRASAFQAEGRGFESRFPLSTRGRNPRRPRMEFGGCGPSDGAGEARAARGRNRNAQVAQSAEHVLGKDEVGGSIPLLGFHSAKRRSSAASARVWAGF